MGGEPDTTQSALADELYRRYVTDASGSAGLRRKLRYWRKRTMWLFVISAARVLKRTIDIVGSLTLIVLGLPFLPLLAFLIKWADNGPILFWQTRVGYRGREFPFPKFRSMEVHAEQKRQALDRQNDHHDGVTFKMARDPRVTWIGRIVRKTSIDELPQLWCVLKGEMSLVGPRPPLPAEVQRYSLADRRRLEAVPGLTCIWQVSGRSQIPFDRQVDLDVQYIESQSLWLDLKLLLLTVPAVVLGKGAY